MKVTQNITSNSTVLLGTLHKPRALTGWQGSFFVYGTGYGTVSWLFSPDGTTANLLPLTDYAGTAISSTANDAFNVTFGNGNTNSDQPKFYATLASGSTTVTIDLTVGYFDNQ